jgi:hypothetical protein
MKRFSIAIAALTGLCAAYLLAHWALIEVGREVIVLRTQEADGGWFETRLWIVDDGDVSWLHGADSRWMHNLEARPTVEIERAGETHRYQAEPVPCPQPRVHQLLREKYGLADRWVRLMGPDDEFTRAVRLSPLEEP